MGFISNGLESMVDAAIGNNSKGTDINTFLSKFYSSEGNFVNQLDPRSTFEITMEFFPHIEPKNNSNDSAWYSRLGNAATTFAKSAVKNAANNLTGGLLGSIMNSKVDIMKKHDQFETYDGKSSHTFMEYLAAANLLVGKEDWFGEEAGNTETPLILNLGPYVQEVTIPNLIMPAEAKSITPLGEFPINGTYIKPDNQTLALTILNTTASIHERIFYPWMREVTLPYWSYNEQPYTTATITIDFSKHNDTKYVFCGCRPSQIFTLQANQDTSDGQNLKRQVVFIFDYMFVTSNLTVTESVGNKLLSTGKALVKGATNAINL